MNSIGPVHYRLSDHWTEDGRVEVEATKFYVLKETDCGYWVLPEYCHRHLGFFPEWVDKHKRWTPKLGGRYCQPSLAEAKLHYSIRKRHELRHIEARLDKCLQVLGSWEDITLDLLETDGRVDLGAVGSKLFKPPCPLPLPMPVLRPPSNPGTAAGPLPPQVQRSSRR